jgi:hypothetical protein
MAPTWKGVKSEDSDIGLGRKPKGFALFSCEQLIRNPNVLVEFFAE